MTIDALMDKTDDKCDMFNKGFNDKDTLLSHLSLKACYIGLTDEEKFMFTFWNKSYYYKLDLRRHVKTKHRRNTELSNLK